MTNIYGWTRSRTLHFLARDSAIIFVIGCICSLYLPATVLPASHRQKGRSSEVYKVTTVLLVRHAEKSASPSNDPALSPIGQARAQSLVDVIGDADIKAVYATQYLRTQETAIPLAKHLGLDLNRIDASETNKLVDQVLSAHAGEVVLIVGHSNTIPQIIEALGGGRIPDLNDSEFDNLFIVTVYKPGRAKVVKLKYGNLENKK